MSEKVDPGWYQNPDGSKSKRYWDGTRWTNSVAPIESENIEEKTKENSLSTNDSYPAELKDNDIQLKGNKRYIFPSQINLIKNEQPYIVIDISNQNENIVNRFKKLIDYPDTRHYWYIYYELPENLIIDESKIKFFKDRKIEVTAYRDLDQKDHLKFIFVGLTNISQSEQELILRRFINQYSPTTDNWDASHEVDQMNEKSNFDASPEPTLSTQNKIVAPRGLFAQTINHISKNYLTFSGRTPRRYFWIYQLLFFVPPIIGIFLFSLLVFVEVDDIAIIFGQVFLAVLLIGLIPIELGMRIRRLHDIGLSGWTLLLTFVPLINIFFTLYYLFAPSQIGPNKYGGQI